jgi:hypothetical protein
VVLVSLLKTSIHVSRSLFCNKCKSPCVVQREEFVVSDIASVRHVSQPRLATSELHSVRLYPNKELRCQSDMTRAICWKIQGKSKVVRTMLQPKWGQVVKRTAPLFRWLQVRCRKGMTKNVKKEFVILKHANVTSCRLLFPHFVNSLTQNRRCTGWLPTGKRISLLVSWFCTGLSKFYSCNLEQLRGKCLLDVTYLEEAEKWKALEVIFYCDQRFC